MKVPDLNDWFASLEFVAGGIIAGLIIEKVVLGLLKKMALRTKWRGDEIIVDSLRGTAFLVCMLAGAFGALQISPVEPHQFLLLQRILLVLLILTLTITLARMGRGFVGLMGERFHGGFPSATIYGNLVGILVFTLGFLTILHSLGVSIAPALAALGVGGLAVALALQEPLSNLFSGLQIIASGQISRGDYVKLQTGEEGIVTDITWRSTTLLGTANHAVIIPNAKLASNVITNFSLPTKEINFTVQARVSFGTNLSTVEKIVLEIGSEVMKGAPGGVPDFKPLIRFASFGDTGVVFNVILRAKEYTDQSPLTHEFLSRLHTRFGKEGIEIPVLFRK